MAKIIKSKHFEAILEKNNNLTTIHIERKKINGDTEMFSYMLTEENRIELIKQLNEI